MNGDYNNAQFTDMTLQISSLEAKIADAEKYNQEYAIEIAYAEDTHHADYMREQLKKYENEVLDIKNTLNKLKASSLKFQDRNISETTQKSINYAISKYTIVPLENPKNNVVAVASVTFYNSLTVNNVTINVNSDGELFVRMPQKRTNQGNFIDVVHPLSVEGRKNINNTLLNGLMQRNLKAQFTVDKNVKISAQNSVRYPDGQYGNNLARLDIVVNDMVVHNAKIFSKDNDTVQLALPSYKGKNGFTSICVPSNKDVFKAMNEAAVTEFNTEYKFEECSDVQLEALKKSGLHFNSNVNSAGVNIIKFRATDTAQINNVLTAANAARI